MSTRKSLRQHAIFQHVLRSFSDLQQFLGSLDGIDKEELKVVRKVIANPDLLWKRGRQTMSECDHVKIKEEPIEVKSVDDMDIDGLLAKKIKIEPVFEEYEDEDEMIEEEEK